MSELYRDSTTIKMMLKDSLKGATDATREKMTAMMQEIAAKEHTIRADTHLRSRTRPESARSSGGFPA